jgi:amino acid transporter
MISLLPEPGAPFSLPNNFLLRGIVRKCNKYFPDIKGFATAYCYVLGYAFDIPDKAIAFSVYMGYWKPDVSPFVWISIFVIPPLIFNYFNARRYGDIEYTITAIKIVAILWIIVLGFIIVAGGTGIVPLLATNDNTQPIFCGENQTDCLPAPGFKCKCPLSMLIDSEIGNNRLSNRRG